MLQGENRVGEAASLLTSLQASSAPAAGTAWQILKGSWWGDSLLPEQDLPNAPPTRCFGGGQAV